ncbi:MAG: hypothetical protein AAGI53_01680 [Planctomycetota bacterium]
MTATTHLTRTRQVLLQMEPTLGTPIDFGQSGVPARVVADAEEMAMRSSRGEFERGGVPGSLTNRTQRVGASPQEVHLTKPMSDVPANAPQWYDMIRAMGFAPYVVNTIDTDGFSPAPPAVGATIGNNATLSSATKTARVAHVEGSRVYYVTLTGAPFADADTLFDDAGVQNQAAVSAGQTEQSAGFQFRPVTEREGQTPDSLTAEYRIGGQRHTVGGARGRGEIRLNADQPAMLRGEFRGAFIDDGSGAPRAGDLVLPSDMPAIVDAPVIKAVPFVLTSSQGSHVPVVASCTINLNNTLEDRRTAATDTTASIAAQGFQPPAITAREITVSIDPEHDPGALNVVSLANSETTIELLARIGSLTGTSGLLVVRAPALQILGDISDSDRNGIATDSLTLTAVGTDDDELEITHIVAPA